MNDQPATETPRTDAVAFPAASESRQDYPPLVVLADFARTLEKELSALTAERDNKQTLNEQLNAELLEAREQVIAEKHYFQLSQAAIKAVWKQYDQAIAERDAALARVKELEAMVNTVRDAGDKAWAVERSALKQTLTDLAAAKARVKLLEEAMYQEQQEQQAGGTLLKVAARSELQEAKDERDDKTARPECAEAHLRAESSLAARDQRIAELEAELTLHNHRVEERHYEGQRGMPCGPCKCVTCRGFYNALATAKAEAEAAKRELAEALVRPDELVEECRRIEQQFLSMDTENADLKARISSLEQDRDRLDWLERASFDDLPAAHCLRAAIDAARALKPEA